ncbi:MAG: DEAD/DEAH box helicase, partial [Vulcanimicrobiaceae bacterium]
MKTTPRPYQADAVRHALAAHDRGERLAYFSMPTGTGKSLVLAGVAQALTSRGRILAVVHRRELVEQLAATLGRELAMPIAIAMGGRCPDRSARVVVGSVQTFGNRTLGALLVGSEVPIAALLIDESHHVARGNSYGILIANVRAHSPSAFVLGCTATPARSTGGRMQDVLAACVFARRIPQMIDAGVLAPLSHRRVEVAFALCPIRKARGDYAIGALDAAMIPSVVTATARETAPMIGGRRSIAFCVSVRHAHELAHIYATFGIRAAVVYGEQPRDQREAAIAAWRVGELDVLTNV